MTREADEARYEVPDLPLLSEDQIASMSPDELIEAVGGEDRARAIYQWAHYQYVAPEMARKHILDFARYMNPNPESPFDLEASRYRVAKHHRLLGDLLMTIINGSCMRLLVSMPPQHGKSQLATRLFLAFHVGTFPWKHLLMGTYNQTFAEEFGDDVRNIIAHPHFKAVFPGVALRTGSKAKDHMVTTEGGKLSFVGRGGAGTGRPADGFLFDDPIKDAKEAESKTIRDDSWNWFTRVANTRCHNLSWQLGIMTRWSDDDIIARLTDPKNPHYDEDVAKQWTVINLPAIIDTDDLAKALGVDKGSALWPERFPIPLLETARKMDPIGFSALYMGRPTPPEGAFYKDHQILEYRSMQDFPRHVRFYLTGDLAVSPERTADKSCVGIWGLDDNDELWLHPELVWDRKSSDQVVDSIIDLGVRFQAMEAFFEKGQIDRAIGPFLEKRMAEEVEKGRKAHFNITRIPVAGNKGVRSMAVRGRMTQRRVHFPVFAPWWPAAKEQMLKFTGSGNDKEDDFCDMVAMIGQAMDSQIPASAATSNVVKMPKPGTFGWTVWAHKREQRQRAKTANLRGW